ncbi:MAG: hypothetical protein JO246_09665 [Frankiaceae bacterium]|nr:hypothetical protein [Frankiaceae bacterium]
MPPIPPSNYRTVDGTYDSDAMRSRMDWEIALPPRLDAGPAPAPLVLVLPGASGVPTDLTTGVGLTGFATAAGLGMAFACPANGGPLYYHPRASGLDPMAWILDEFLPMIERRFGVGGSTANRAIYGTSMGGYGALMFAAQRPRQFCAAVACSPAIYESFDAAVTGHPITFDTQSDWDRWGLWNRLSDLNGVPVMINCGDADPFAVSARQLLSRIPGAVGGIGRGCHDFGIWRRSAPAQLEFLAGHFTASD